MLLVALSVLAADAPPPPIVNGDATRDLPQVVTLWAANSRGEGYNFCSGTLIAGKWVVTAAHCVVAMDEELPSYGLDYLYVIVGYDLNTSAGVQEYVEAKAWHSHASYDDRTLDNDIGIVELQSAITSIDFMPVNKDQVRNSDIGEDFRYVGWGITSDTAQDTSKKRYADIPLYQITAHGMEGYDPVDGQNVCSGDSGGAVLEFQSSGTTFELAGVNSYVYAPNGDTTPCAGGATGAIRVDAYLSWIEGYTPVYSESELGDADTDADTDSDSDSDSDTDTDADTDTDVTNTDTTITDGEVVSDPVRPNDVGEDYGTAGMCATTPAFGGWGLTALAAAVGLRRRSVPAGRLAGPRGMRA